MLPKKIRLTTGLFDQVFKTGKIQYGRLFWARSSLLPDSPTNRFAVVVPKKIAQTAVLRNKTKRLVYRAIEKLGSDIFSNQSGRAVIFGVKSDISKVPFTEIVEELRKIG